MKPLLSLRYAAPWLLGLLLVVTLSACEQLALPKPETFNQRLALGYGTVTVLRDTTTSLLRAGKISATDAQNIQAQCDNARAGLDIARAMSGTDLSSADSRLQATLTALTALQDYLLTRQALPPASSAKGEPLT